MAEKPSFTSADVHPGSVLCGRFRLERRLGRGGFGEVWHASELLPDGSVVREVALKLMSADSANADWTQEAKVLAALRHRSLVTIYSAGVLDLNPSLPFVSMELLQGDTLADLLTAKGPIAWRRVISWAREIASALDAIHQQGVIHLDLKPSNLFLSKDNIVRVLDFGIAHHRANPSRAPWAPSYPDPENRNSETPSMEALATDALLQMQSSASEPQGVKKPLPTIAGTLGFIAPEVIEGRDITPAADAYALGACLFQLLTSRLPQRARSAPTQNRDPTEIATWRAEMRTSTVAGELTDLAALIPDLPAGVLGLVRQLLALDPSKRLVQGTLFTTVEAVYARPYGIPDPPYRGLRAYGKEAEGLLFGREEDANRLAAELGTQPLLVLQGASGSGKSSLAVAGVVPALAKSFADNCDDWVAVAIRPGHDVDAALRQARERISKFAGIVLIVDQLEELFTQLDTDAQSKFALALRRYASPLSVAHGTAHPSPGIRVLCTLREDFTTRVATLLPPGLLAYHTIRFVAPPSTARVHDIVVKPAELAQVRIDNEAPVVNDVLQDLRSGEGRLPLISFALTEWWSTRKQLRLSASAWKELGGIAGALSKHADATLASLPVEAQRAARILCLRLVTVEGTRARIREEEIRKRGASFSYALDTFMAARLITVEDSAHVSLSHEALLSAWGTLRTWVAEEQADRTHAAALDTLANAWRNEHRSQGSELLLQGTRLTRALELTRHRPELTQDLHEFVRASHVRARWRSVLANGLWFSAIAVVVGAIVLYGIITRQHDMDIQKREQNLQALVRTYDEEQQQQHKLEQSLLANSTEITGLRQNIRSCQDSLLRIESDHRAELAHRFAKDSFEQSVMQFLLLWEHLWNLHDMERIRTLLAPNVHWLDQQQGRDQVIETLGQTWRRSPSSRVMIGEVNIIHHEGNQTLVRMTREERVDGQASLAVLHVRIEGDRLEHFQLESAEVEKVIRTGRLLGCAQ